MDAASLPLRSCMRFSAAAKAKSNRCFSLSKMVRVRATDCSRASTVSEASCTRVSAAETLALAYLYSWTRCETSSFTFSRLASFAFSTFCASSNFTCASSKADFDFFLSSKLCSAAVFDSPSTLCQCSRVLCSFSSSPLPLTSAFALDAILGVMRPLSSLRRMSCCFLSRSASMSRCFSNRCLEYMSALLLDMARRITVPSRIESIAFSAMACKCWRSAVASASFPFNFPMSSPMVSSSRPTLGCATGYTATDEGCGVAAANSTSPAEAAAKAAE
mmetsp:Transcript_78662/g.220462  ORF Transcript_78662/g.220462 Transcript_78662/m.220462 type:complete len:275 (+) Transcript_78662:187-1011(+)